MKIFRTLIAVFAVAVVFVSCGGDESSVVEPPIFTNPATKLEQLSGQDFEQLLLSEAVALEPLVTTSGSQMHMGYWSATGNKVKVWCFVNGAKRARVFFTYEFPELQTLEAAGALQVFFAKTIDADWTVADDWDEGTQNAPTPLDSNVAVYSLSAEPVLSSEIEDEIVFEIADAFLDGYFGSGDAARQNALKELERRNPGFTSVEYETAFSKGVILAVH